MEVKEKWMIEAPVCELETTTCILDIVAMVLI